MIFNRITDLIFPRHCAACGRKLAPDEMGVCLRCHMELPRTDLFDNPCRNSLVDEYFMRADIEKSAAFMYFTSDTRTANIIYNLKYNGDANVGVEMGRLMAQEVLQTHFFDDIDAMLPVPITYKRFLERGYNQSEMLAKGIRKVTGLPIITYALIRIRFEQSQTSLSRDERIKNVEGAFRVVDDEALRNKHVLIIDDIITTSATTGECAKMLLTVPGCKVSILSLGRTHNL